MYCRHYKLEAELAEVNWRVKWDDILFSAQERKKLERSASRFSINRVSIGNHAIVFVDPIKIKTFTTVNICTHQADSRHSKQQHELKRDIQ